PTMQIFGSQGMEEMGLNLQEVLGNLPFGKKSKKRKLTVPEARRVLAQDEAEKLVDKDSVARDALERVQSNGIVFIDEIDKVALPAGPSHGPDVSRGGVQRDLLPIVEGSTVNTKYGPVKTDHVLFIAAGAFHLAKVSDLLPELQGRFPIRVELEALTQADLVRILTEPRNALTRQYSALLGAEGVELVFDQSGVEELGRVAQEMNTRMQNIGARRLHTVLEQVAEDAGRVQPLEPADGVEVLERDLPVDLRQHESRPRVEVEPDDLVGRNGDPRLRVHRADLALVHQRQVLLAQLVHLQHFF